MLDTESVIVTSSEHTCHVYQLVGRNCHRTDAIAGTYSHGD